MTGRACLLVLAMLACACGGDAGEAVPQQESPPAAEAARPELDAEDPTILRRPFTAGQIRDEWIPGFTIKLRQRTPAGTTFERWTVVAADDEHVEIESVPLDEQGNPSGDPSTGKDTWTTLRDHATFPAELSRREEVVRHTPLGELDGWLYTVRDPAGGTVSEFFFARSLPGAPVQMRVTRGNELVAEMIQLERHRP